MGKGKIVFKLCGGYILIVLISMLIIGIFFINSFKSYTLTNKERSMMNKGRDIAKATAPYLTKEDAFKEYNNFIGLLDSSVNARVWVLDKKGQVLAMSNGEVCEGQDESYCGSVKTDKELVDRVLKGEEITNEGYSSYYNEPMLSIGVPVYDASKNIVGAIFLYSPLIGITETLDSAFNFLVIAILGASVLTGILSLFYSRIIAKPLLIMNKAAKEMMKGNYNVRVNVRQKDEIGELGNSIDLLASKLGYTIDQLFQEQTKLKDLIASISEGILAFDSSMGLINYNEALKRLFDYDKVDNIEDAVKKELKENGIWDEFIAVIKHGENRIFTCEWNIRILKFTLSPVRNNNLDIIGIVGLVQDISESERLEQMRREFVTNVSHEFRTPLSLIQGYVEALKDGVVTGKDGIAKYHDRILEETKGLEILIKDLLDLGKLQSGKINLNIEEIDISSLVTEVSRNLQTIAAKKHIAIESQITGEVPHVTGDYDRLKQMLVIFLDNAIKYSPQDTMVHVSLKVSDYVYITIKDHGIGIPREDIPYIWDRFYKVDKSRQQSDKGTGLGLSIAKHIIELHKGVVKLESELGRGTTVEVGLPVAKKKV